MAYQYVREPLTDDNADQLANACHSIKEKLIIWPLLDCGLRISGCFCIKVRKLS